MSVCPFVLFILAIVSSVILRFTNSDYPFGIFKLFLNALAVYPVLGHRPIKLKIINLAFAASPQSAQH